MDKRNERMLEEVLRQPGNETCADCHAPAPRWASVNLGIFLCVACASVHRKLGTHKSRVKSVTLDTWSRDQIKTMQTIGNILSNSTYNPNESLNPPPNTTGSDERDSDLEKYIRRKYELGSYKAGVRVGNGTAGVTSLGRARGGGGGSGSGSGSGYEKGVGQREVGNGYREGEGRGNNGVRENVRNPELNGIVSVKREGGNSRGFSDGTGGGGTSRDRDLPALPLGAGAGGLGVAPRTRPASKSPGPVWASAKIEEAKLIDFGHDDGGALGPANGVTGYNAASSSNGSGNASNGMTWATQYQTQPQQPATASNGYGQVPFGNSNSYQNGQAGPSFSQQSPYNMTMPANSAQQSFAPYNLQQPIQSQSQAQPQLQQYAQSSYNPFHQQPHPQQQQLQQTNSQQFFPSSSPYAQNTQQSFLQPQPQQSFLQPGNTPYTPMQQGQQYFATSQGQGMNGGMGGSFPIQQGGQQWAGMGMGMSTGMAGYGQGLR